MDYWHLIYVLPAIIAGTTILAYVSPWKFQARFTPLAMFLVGLLVLCMPEMIDMALALTLPAAWLQERILGISFTAHDPLPVKFRMPDLRRPKVVLQQFVDRAYPNPDTVEPQAEDPDEPPEHEPGDTVSTVQSYVPAL